MMSNGSKGRAIILVALGALALAALWRFRPQSDHDIRVYSHDGHWILKPSLVIPAPTGGEPDFESHGPALITIPARFATRGREMLVSGPGCGLLRTEFDGQDRITLPPPIRATIRVPGDFPLPSGDHGIELEFQASGASPALTSAVAGAAVAASHWDHPESPVWDESQWLDPETRSITVLLPCTGAWHVEWLHIDRPPPGESRSLSILYGKGEAVLTVTADGEELALTINPDDLDTMEFGLGDEHAAADSQKAK